MIRPFNRLNPQIPSLLKRLLRPRTIRHSWRQRRILRRRQKQCRNGGRETAFGESVGLFVPEVELAGAVPV
jgi:hypothetical protein